MEASSSRIPEEWEREVQSARRAPETSSPKSVQEEGFIERAFEASLSGRDMEMDETTEAEVTSGHPMTRTILLQLPPK